MFAFRFTKLPKHKTFLHRIKASKPWWTTLCFVPQLISHFFVLLAWDIRSCNLPSDVFNCQFSFLNLRLLFSRFSYTRALLFAYLITNVCSLRIVFLPFRIHWLEIVVIVPVSESVWGSKDLEIVRKRGAMSVKMSNFCAFTPQHNLMRKSSSYFSSWDPTPIVWKNRGLRYFFSAWTDTLNHSFRRIP